MALEYPYQWVDVPEEEVKRVVRQPKRQYIRSIPGDVWMPKKFETIAEKIYNFEVRPDDIWIVTYPKCGTTWTQELVWQIVHNVDIETSKANPILTRSPFLEFEAIAPDHLCEMLMEKTPENKKEIIRSVLEASVDYAASKESPRIIKSHLPMSMLPPKIFELGCKVIYVCRNPKDACVSFFHHSRLMQEDYVEDFNHLEEMFLAGTFMFGNYFYHLKDAWQYKKCSNFKMMWYEDMKRDLITVIRDLTRFLGYHLTELKILTLDDFLYIGNQRKDGITLLNFQRSEDSRQLMKMFFRKGEVGDWHNYLTNEKHTKWDKWIKENMEGSDIEIVWD